MRLTELTCAQPQCSAMVREGANQAVPPTPQDVMTAESVAECLPVARLLSRETDSIKPHGQGANSDQRQAGCGGAGPADGCRAGLGKPRRSGPTVGPWIGGCDRLNAARPTGPSNILSS